MSSTSQLVKNSIFLFIRMFFLMGISLYTSRILLQELGISDYGIYGIVGGVVGLFASLRALFSSAIQRFINVELGKGNSGEVNKIFNLGFEINLGIAIIFALILEFAGMWFLENKLTIPIERYETAVTVFHFSVATAIVGIMLIPFDAIIIAKQKMDFYAYSSMFDAIIKLGAIFLLQYIDYDKLIVYAALIFSTTIIHFIINQIYCKLTFEECKYRFCWDKAKLKEMASFSGWNFAGITAYSLVNEGINICLNMFGGVTLNASRSVTYQVRGAIMNFVTNINTAITPHSIQLYAQGKLDEYFKLMFFSSKTIVFIYTLLALPIFVFIEPILMLWLGKTPPYAVEFIRATLVFLFFRSFHSPIDLLFKAAGKIRGYQIVEMIVLALPLPFSYFSLMAGMEPYWVFIYMAVFELINLFVILFLAQRITELKLTEYAQYVAKPIILSMLIIISAAYIVINNVESSVLQLLLGATIALATLFFVGMDSTERNRIYQLLRIKK